MLKDLYSILSNEIRGNKKLITLHAVKIFKINIESQILKLLK